MFFYIVIGITNMIILASMMYVYGRAATVQEHRILDVTFTDEQLEDEDIDYLRELAERDYVARIAQNTLAPNIQVTFTGDINQEMDYEKIGPAVAQILQDEIDTAPEGLY